MRRWLLLMGMTGLLAGCDVNEGSRGPRGATDAGVTDASVTDASVTDASATDASATDASATDAEVPYEPPTCASVLGTTYVAGATIELGSGPEWRLSIRPPEVEGCPEAVFEIATEAAGLVVATRARLTEAGVSRARDAALAAGTTFREELDVSSYTGPYAHTLLTVAGTERRQWHPPGYSTTSIAAAHAYGYELAADLARCRSNEWVSVAPGCGVEGSPVTDDARQLAEAGADMRFVVGPNLNSAIGPPPVD